MMQPSVQSLPPERLPPGLRNTHLIMQGKIIGAKFPASIKPMQSVWRMACFREVAAKNPDIPSDDFMVDATAYYLAKCPEKFDVIVAANQYGDILSDLAAGLVGSLGLAPGANVGEDGLIVVEASHGAAPDIAGQDKANPIATILSAAMMLRYSFDLDKEADAVEAAVKSVIAEGYRTVDIMADGMKQVSTTQMGDLIAERV